MYKRAQTKTHPWDGDIDDPRLKSIWFSLLLVALFFIIFQSSSAQKAFPIPEVIEIDLHDSENQLSRSELQTANDYKDILSKLEFLIHNHLGYFSDYENFEGLKYQNLLLKTLINIEKGTYCLDVDKLSDDLSILTSSLKKEERNLKKDASLKKLYKNVYTLRSDFEMIEDIIDEEIADQLVTHKSSLQTMKIFLEKQRTYEKQQEDYQITMYELQEQINDEVSHLLEVGESLRITFDEVQMRELLKTEDLQKELEEVLDFVFTIELPGKTITIKIPTDSLGREIIIPDIPTPPIPPDISHNRVHYQYDYSKSGKKALSNQYKDSVLVKSTKIPIFINNQLGDIEVQGWDKNKIVADYSYKVISDTYEDTEDFLKSVTLEIKSDKSGIYVTSDFPSLSNAKRQVVNSNMILYVPKKNIIDITNSFGKSIISNLKNNLNIKTKNSDVIVENIYGDVTAISKHGSVYLDRITGNIDLTSKYGKVVVNNVTSSIEITNSYSPIIISDSRGDVSLVNSGEIEVYNHTGDIDIKNENGETIVQSIIGDLTLTGSNMPFRIHFVNGSIDIKNKNSIIELSDVTGESIVLNYNGLIKAQNMQGPIDFSNHSGNIHFIANNQLHGNSVIRSDYGLINLVLPKQSNILLKASTEGGSIINSYQTKIVKDDFLSTTTIALGDKSNKLQVTGTNTTIIIKDSK